MKPFDKKFADDMRDTFDNWQEPVDEQAWLQMKQKLGGKSKKTVVIFLRTWPAKVAATMLLGLLSYSAWYYMANPGNNQMLVTQSNDQTESLQNRVPVNDDSLASAMEIIPENAIEFADHEAIESITKGSQQLLAEDDEKADHSHKNQAEPDVDLPADGFTNENIAEPAISENYLVEEVDSVISRETELPVKESESEYLAITISSETDSLALADNNVSDSTVSPVVASQMTDEQIIAHNLLELNAERETPPRNSYIEISAGSLKTYSSAELASGLGFSAGVMGYWAVGNNVSLSSGGVLLYNQFTLDNPVAATSKRNLNESVAMPSFDYSSPANTLYSVTSNYTDFEFTAIDIPLNVRFKVADRTRSQLFVSGGFSSLLYLQQNYTRYTEYATVSNQFGLSGSQEVVSGTASFSDGDSYEAFRQFDFGRLINFSMGYLVKRERHSILIEPHIKYPIGSITSMDLRIGMAGISLKYNFLEK